MGKLTKPVMLDSDVIGVLDEIREERHCSYNEATKVLIKHRPTVIDRMNDCFDELKRLAPEMRDGLEIMRLMVVRYHRLPKGDRDDKKKRLEEMLEEGMVYVVKREGE